MVERRFEEPGVGGSIPSCPTYMGTLISKFSDEEFSNIVKESETVSEIAFKLGYRSKGGGVTKLIKDKIGLKLDRIGGINNQRITKRLLLDLDR